jgi:hypothetical protein
MFDKIKDALTGAKSGKDLGNVAELGGYEKYLQGVTFPASKDEVIGALQANGAADGLKDHVMSLSQDRFDNPQEIFRTLLKR